MIRFLKHRHYEECMLRSNPKTIEVHNFGLLRFAPNDVKRLGSILCLSLGIILGSSLKANDVCDCISVLTYPAPNDQIRYVARCYLNGEKKHILEERTFNNQEEADTRTASLLKSYEIQKDACIALPSGKMILAHPK